MDAGAWPSAVRAAATGQADVVTVFQPIVSLDRETAVGFEALSRWRGLSGASAERVFRCAAAHGVASQLDRRCTQAAVDAALAARLPDGTLLLINTEPTTAAPFTATEDDAPLIELSTGPRVVFELTERQLLSSPQALLRKLAALRAAGVGIALDDVGGDPDVLAWLGVIDPDIVKLDLSLVQRRLNSEQARILNAVYDFGQRSGALLLAEGIETEAHLERARAVGATLGQGYWFGRPIPGSQLAGAVPGATPKPPVRTARTRIESTTPFEVATRLGAPIRSSRMGLLRALSQDVEDYAERATDRPMVLTAVQPGCRPSSRMRRMCRRMTQTCSLLALFGMTSPPAVGSEVLWVDVRGDDALGAEWALIVLGSHSAFAIIARERADAGRPPSIPASTEDGWFDFVMTTDRSLITSAAASLLGRIP